ncbi:MAG: DUF6089 family protein [Tannerella sp.]|jgi:hypothetical protein|nr:DUF6089 family protein [Tannerella sp.]
MSSAFFQRWFLILLLSAPFYRVHAQEYLYEVGGMGGGASYMGDVNKTAPFKGLNPSLGVVFRYNVNFRVAFKSNLTWARVSGSTEGLANVFPEQVQVAFNRNLIELGEQFEFNFFPYSDKFAYLNTKRFSPYLLVGLGLTVAPGNGETFAGLNLPVGAGVKYKLKNRINLGCEFSVRKLFGDGLDVTDESNRILNNPYGVGGSMMKNKDWYSLLTFSVTWDFGPRNRQCNSTDGVLF